MAIPDHVASVGPKLESQVKRERRSNPLEGQEGKEQRQRIRSHRLRWYAIAVAILCQGFWTLPRTYNEEAQRRRHEHYEEGSQRDHQRWCRRRSSYGAEILGRRAGRQPACRATTSQHQEEGSQEDRESEKAHHQTRTRFHHLAQRDQRFDQEGGGETLGDLGQTQKRSHTSRSGFREDRRWCDRLGRQHVRVRGKYSWGTHRAKCSYAEDAAHDATSYGSLCSAGDRQWNSSGGNSIYDEWECHLGQSNHTTYGNFTNYEIPHGRPSFDEAFQKRSPERKIRSLSPYSSKGRTSSRWSWHNPPGCSDWLECHGILAPNAREPSSATFEGSSLAIQEPWSWLAKWLLSFETMASSSHNPTSQICSLLRTACNGSICDPLSSYGKFIFNGIDYKFRWSFEDPVFLLMISFGIPILACMLTFPFIWMCQWPASKKAACQVGTMRISTVRKATG